MGKHLILSKLGFFLQKYSKSKTFDYFSDEKINEKGSKAEPLKFANVYMCMTTEKKKKIIWRRTCDDL